MPSIFGKDKGEKEKEKNRKDSVSPKLPDGVITNSPPGSRKVGERRESFSNLEQFPVNPQLRLFRNRSYSMDQSGPFPIRSSEGNHAPPSSLSSPPITIVNASEKEKMEKNSFEKSPNVLNGPSPTNSPTQNIIMNRRSPFLSASADRLPQVVLNNSSKTKKSSEGDEDLSSSIETNGEPNGSMMTSSMGGESQTSSNNDPLIDDPYWRSILEIEKAEDTPAAKLRWMSDSDSRITLNRTKEAMFQVQIRFFYGIKTLFVYEFMLQNFLELTSCTYGFMSSVKKKEILAKGNLVCIRTAISRGGGVEEKKERIKTLISDKDSEDLWIKPVSSGQILTSRTPLQDSRSGTNVSSFTLPGSFAPTSLSNMLSVPIIDSKREVIALMTVFNRDKAFTQEDITQIQPYLKTCANLLEAQHNSRSLKGNSNGNSSSSYNVTPSVSQSNARISHAKSEESNRGLNLNLGSHHHVVSDEDFENHQTPRGEGEGVSVMLSPSLLSEAASRSSESSPKKTPRKKTVSSSSSKDQATSPVLGFFSPPAQKSPATWQQNLSQKFGIRPSSSSSSKKNESFLEMLSHCVENGDKKSLRKLLKMKKFVDHIDGLIGDQCRSLMHVACLNNDYEIVDILIESNASVNSRDSLGRTPLHIAIEKKNARIIQTLLSQPTIDTNLVDHNGITAFHLFCEHYSTPNGMRKIFDGFLARKTEMNKQDRVTGETALHKAIMNDSMRGLMVRLLLDHNVDVNLADFNGKSPLHCSVAVNRVELTQELLLAGASINTNTNSGQSPMDIAIMNNGSEKMINLLNRMKELETWMQKIGMQQYVSLFLKENLFKDMLYLVDDKMLADIGISKLGDRMRITSAINEMKESTNISKGLNQLLNVEPKSAASVSSASPSRQRPMRSRRSSVVPPPNPIPESMDNTYTSNQDSSDSSSKESTLQIPGMEAWSPMPQQPPQPSLSSQFDTLRKRIKQNPNDTQSDWIPYNELEFSKQLGSGASGQVYKGYRKSQEVAIKVIEKRPQDIADFKFEFEMLRKLRSSNVVTLFGACLEPQLCLVMEYCSRGSLYDILVRGEVHFGMSQLLGFAAQMTNGTNCLHSANPPILHRDIKTMNFLVSENWSIKICDLGLARQTQSSGMSTLKKLRGTATHISPEICNGQQYTTKSDVYSLSICFWEMAYRAINGKHQTPFAEYQIESLQIVLQTGQGLRPKIPKGTPPMLASLIQDGWNADPSKRPDCNMVLQRLEACQKDMEENPEAWTVGVKQAQPIAPAIASAFNVTEVPIGE
eukprot:TRINITY_DN1438_c0_g1_i1.p1 TRINITY_DN1438_c0_g1~~TRINITY_DN1438_c0_g1_i1.p1  ORF type:complete len:1279 (-),score=531.40 TRINITY_DN1438_c0_g1_i1:189-4025(-)